MGNENKNCDYQLPLPSRDTFEGADSGTKLNYLFDMNCVALNNQNKIVTYLQTERKRERRITFGLSSGLGAGAGTIVVLLKEMFAFFR